MCIFLHATDISTLLVSLIHLSAFFPDILNISSSFKVEKSKLQPTNSATINSNMLVCTEIWEKVNRVFSVS